MTSSQKPSSRSVEWVEMAYLLPLDLPVSETAEPPPAQVVTFKVPRQFYDYHAMLVGEVGDA